MKKTVKVAVIDTGVNIRHSYLEDCIIGGIGFRDNGNFIEIKENFEDDNGHGTACASIIKKEYNYVKIFAIKALDREGKTNIQILEESLKYLIDTDIQLINLSLSISTYDITEELLLICEKLVKMNKIIICSLSNGLEESYPAILKNIIGVRGSILNDRNSIWYNKNYKIQCVIDSRKYLTPYLNDDYVLFGQCNSHAAAKLTGKIASIIASTGVESFEQIQDRLSDISTKKYWRKNDLYEIDHIMTKEIYSKKDKDILDRIVSVISKNFNLKSEQLLYKKRICDGDFGIHFFNIFTLVKLLEEEFKVKLNYMEISRENLVSIYSLADLIKKYKE